MIITDEYDVRYIPSRYTPDWGRWASGRKLTMADGSVWFHDYSGAAPFRV